MPAIHLGEMESRFADLIWRNALLSSRRLAELAEEALSWKRTTTYTVLKRLCDRGLFQNDGSTVQVLIFTPCRASSLWRRRSTAPCPPSWQSSALGRSWRMLTSNSCKKSSTICGGECLEKCIFSDFQHESHRQRGDSVRASRAAAAEKSAEEICLRPVGGLALRSETQAADTVRFSKEW